MTKFERVRYEMFLRVRDFGPGHLDRFPESSKAGEMFARVAQATDKIAAQAQSRLNAARDSGNARAETRAAVRMWMLDIARTSRDVARDTDGRAVLHMPERQSAAALLAAARMFLEAGRSLNTEFIARGLDANWERAFTAAIEAFEHGRNERRAGRAGVARARAGIREALVDGFAAIRTLDVIVANSLKHDPVFTATWLRCRTIVHGRRTRLLGQPVDAAETAEVVLKEAS